MFLTTAQKEGFRLPQASESSLYDLAAFERLVANTCKKEPKSKQETLFRYVPTDAEKGLAKSKCFAENPHHVYFGKHVYHMDTNTWEDVYFDDSGPVQIKKRICSNLERGLNPNLVDLHYRFVNILGQFGYSETETRTICQMLGRLLHPFSPNENNVLCIITVPWVLNIFESIFSRIRTDLCTTEKSVFWNTKYCKRVSLNDKLFLLAHECRIAIVTNFAENAGKDRISMFDLKQAIKGETIMIQSNENDDSQAEFPCVWSTHLLFSDLSIKEWMVNMPMFVLDAGTKTPSLNETLESAFLPNEIPFLMQVWNQAYLTKEMND